MNNLAERAYELAVMRKKTSEEVRHGETSMSLWEEFKEFVFASEKKESEHLRDYTEAEEELADILITCLTELHKRKVDVMRLINRKMMYNQERLNNGI